MVFDPYQVLGVSPDSNEEEITRAYRRLAKKYHPDRNPDDQEAARRMQEVNAAYEQIKNPQKQQTGYGGYGQSSYGQSGYGYQDDEENSWDPFSSFFRFYGGGFGRGYGYGRYGKYGRYSYSKYSNYGTYGNYAASHYGQKGDNSIKK